MILVTGGAGYIGSHVAWQLVEQGEKVLIVDLEEVQCEQLLERCEFVRGDIGSVELLKNIFTQYDIDVVMHFAAWVDVAESVANPMKYYLNNTVATCRLINACVQYDVKNFIFSSTAAVYGAPETNPVSEEARCRPINPYGHSKLMAEKMSQDVANINGLSYVLLRYFNVAGTNSNGLLGPQKKETTILIRLAAQKAIGVRDEFSIWGGDWPTPDGTCIRDFIHVCDLSEAHIEALNYLRKGGKPTILNAGYGKGYSVKEVVSAVEKVSGKSLNAIVADRRAGDPAEVVAANKKIKETLNWQPQYDNLELIVRDAINWEKHLFGVV